MSNDKFPKILYVQDPELSGKVDEGSPDEFFPAYENVESTADHDAKVTVAIYELKEVVTVVNKTEIVRGKK